jgi:hypothetical protein
VLEPSTNQFKFLSTRLAAQSGAVAPDTFLDRSLGLSGCHFFGSDLLSQDDTLEFAHSRAFGEPFVLLSNPVALPHCGPSDFVAQTNITCSFIPYSYNAPANDLQSNSKWSSTHCRTCAQGLTQSDPHIIRFSWENGPWNSLSYLQNPFFWRWDFYRSSIPHPYGEPAEVWSVWAMLFCPIGLLSVCTVTYRKALVRVGFNAPPSPSDTSPLTEPVAPPRAGPRLALVEAAITVAVWFLMTLWFDASLTFSKLVVKQSWHPMAAVGVYQSWFSLALVAGFLLLEHVAASLSPSWDRPTKTKALGWISAPVFLLTLYVSFVLSRSLSTALLLSITAGVAAHGVGTGCLRSVPTAQSAHFTVLVVGCIVAGAVMVRLPLAHALGPSAC